MTSTPTRTLRRDARSLTLPAPQWSNILLLASKHGWQPEWPSDLFNASGFDVRESEALALGQTVETIWASVSADPFTVALDPSVNLAQLMKVGWFCLGGAFVIE